jgi:hypothetical protein
MVPCPSVKNFGLTDFWPTWQIDFCVEHSHSISTKYCVGRGSLSEMVFYLKTWNTEMVQCPSVKNLLADRHLVDPANRLCFEHSHSISTKHCVSQWSFSKMVFFSKTWNTEMVQCPSVKNLLADRNLVDPANRLCFEHSHSISTKHCVTKGSLSALVFYLKAWNTAIAPYPLFENHLDNRLLVDLAKRLLYRT